MSFRGYLQAHQLWLDSNGKEGTRVCLDDAELPKSHLEKAVLQDGLLRSETLEVPISGKPT